LSYRVPKIGDQLPRKGGLGKSILRLAGWKIEGELPNVPKFIHIVGPHTSNWDFPVGVLARMALGLDMRFMGKEALFEGFQGKIMRSMGGIPVSLQRGLGETDRLAAEIKAADKYILTITPEGSRFLRTTWRTGYYFIAWKAGIPLVPVYFDFEKKIVGYGDSWMPTGDFNTDVQRVNDYFKNRAAYQPNWFRLHETVHPITDEESPELLPGFTRESYTPNFDNPSGRQ